MVNCQRPVLSLGVSIDVEFQTYSLITKPLNIWAQLIIEIARKQNKRKQINTLHAGSLLGETIPLSLTLHYFKGAVSNHVLYINSFPVAIPSTFFIVFNLWSNYQIKCPLPLNPV